MKLSQLLKAAGLSCTQDVEITHITCDSRQVEPGALFVAQEGFGSDGRDFIPWHGGRRQWFAGVAVREKSP